MENRLNPDSHATTMPTGDRADKHAPEAEPHQTLVSGDEAKRRGEEALAGSPLTPSDVHEQSSYQGTEADVGQQSATAKKVEETSESSPREDPSQS